MSNSSSFPSSYDQIFFWSFLDLLIFLINLVSILHLTFFHHFFIFTDLSFVQ